MNIQLESDFIDFYDFDLPMSKPTARIVWNRFHPTDVGKIEGLKQLKDLGWKVVPFGNVVDLLEALPEEARVDEVEVVVYFDEYIHGGYASEKLPIQQAALECPTYNASLYIPQELYPTVYRLYGVGAERHVVKIWSDDDWRSNWGNERRKRVFERVTTGSIPLRSFPPVWCVDMVKTTWGDYLAIDFDTAPKLADTPLVYLGEERVATAVMSYIFETNDLLGRTEF
jgi:hypothetical protein